MASYKDNSNLATSQYISPIDPNVYGQVGMLKQGQYDQGLQKVQNYFSNIAGIDIARDVDKQYLDTKLAELNNKVRSIPGGDFSKQSTIAQAGMYASQISSDPIVQNAAISTARYKKGLAEMENAKKAGKSAPQNEWLFQRDAAAWQAGGLDTSFNSSYNQYTDVMGEFMKTFKELHPTSSLTQDAFRIGADGKVSLNPAMQEVTNEGITPAQVQRAAELTFSNPAIKNQLSIDGLYQYRAYDEIGLKQQLAINYNRTAADIEKQIKQLQVKQTVNTNPGGDITKQIEQLKYQGTELLDNYNKYSNLSGDSLKTALYENNLRSQLVNTFNWNKQTTKLVDNPLYKAQQDQLKMELNTREFDLNKEKFQWDKAKDQIKLAQDQQKLDAKLDKDGNAIEGVSSITMNAPVPETEGAKNFDTFKQQFRGAQDSYNNSVYKNINVLANASNIAPPYKLDANNRFIPNVGAGGYKNAAEAKDAFDRIYTEARTSYSSGTSTQQVNDMMTEITPLYDRIRNMRTKWSEGETAYNNQLNSLNAQFSSRVSNIPSTKVYLDNPSGGFLSSPIERPVSSTEMLKAISGNSNVIKVEKNEKGDVTKFLINNNGRLEEVSSSSRRNLEDLYTKVTKATTGSREYKDQLNAVQSNRNDYYKNLQLSFVPQETTLTPQDAKGRALLQQSISTVLRNAKPADTENETIDEMLSMLRNTKESKVDDNVYSYSIDRANNIGRITISNGETTKTATVPLDNLMRFPGVKSEDAFWNRYGDNLELTGRTTTDVSKAGEFDAKPIPQPFDSDFNVKHHLIGDGNGNYKIKLYIRDRQGRMLKDGVLFNPPGVGMMTPAEVMTSLETLKQPQVIKSILQYNQ